MSRGLGHSGGHDDGRSWPACHRNQLAGFGVAAVVLASGVLAFMPHPQPAASRAVAADCGLVHCSATLPPMASASRVPNGSGQPGKTPSASKHGAASGRASASTRPAPSVTPTPVRAPLPVMRTTAPPPTQLPSPPLTVGYAVVQRQSSHWGTRFVGRFTLVNHTGSAITGWALQAGLVRSRVHWVSASASGYPGYPDWSPVRDGMIITGPRSSEAIPAHGAAVLYFSAEGSSAGLSGCTVNGSSC